MRSKNRRSRRHKEKIYVVCYKYIRSKVTDQEGMFYIFIDELQYAISREGLKNPEGVHLYDDK